jgi:hypothetical protein
VHSIAVFARFMFSLVALWFLMHKRIGF